MISVTTIASYICVRYQKTFGKRIDEMKLHKLLYFSQRECLIQLGEPLFEEQFEAWKYGPVLVGIRQLYKQDLLHESLSPDLEDKYRPVFDMVFETYAHKDAWSLSSLTHGEYSWRQARQNVDRDANSTSKLNIDDIAKDAERIKIRRFIYYRMQP